MQFAFDQIWPVLSGVARSIAIKSIPQEWEDVMSELMVLVWADSSGRGDFESLEHAKAYYLRCLHNKITDHLRSMKRRTELVSRLVPASAGMVNAGVYAHMDILGILTAAESLGVRFLIVALGLVRGDSHSEIARANNWSKMTVGRDVKRILLKSGDAERVTNVRVSNKERENNRREIMKKRKFGPESLQGIKDVPASLEAWRKQCGGEGMCLGMSGKKTGSKFAPGYDAKLKSLLNRLQTANAKKLAAALGWKLSPPKVKKAKAVKAAKSEKAPVKKAKSTKRAYYARGGKAVKITPPAASAEAAVGEGDPNVASQG